MAQPFLLTGYLTAAGHGELKVSFLDNVQGALLALLDRGRDTGNWRVSEPLVDDLTVVVNEHDRQLLETRLQAIVEASERLNRTSATSVAKQRSPD
jgi:hypothetical protein